jgi:Caspase domain
VSQFYRRLTGLLLAVVVVFSGEGASAAARVHALVIGNNGVFPHGGDDPPDPTLAPLEFADDDAAAVSSFVGQIASSVHLLTVMDLETQALYPRWVASARPPTQAAVEQAVAAMSRAIAADHARGDESVVWFFFSGHGSISRRGEAALALSDTGMTQEFLYEKVLAKLPADYIHLFIDACHAESVVRPRDAHAEVVSVPPATANALLLRKTLARFPNTGAILVASDGAQAHEWDAIGHGIFTHELLSALRGAADVNRDRSIEYSEVYAFISAANRSIADPRARLSIVSRAPDRNRRVSLLDLSEFPRARNTWLTGLSGQRGMLQVVDDRGRYVATLHNAAAFSSDLLVPAGANLFVRAARMEAQVSTRPGQAVAFERLRFSPPISRSRGEISSAIRRGFFATPFSRAYYEGFTDRSPEFLPVAFADAPSDAGTAGTRREASARSNGSAGIRLLASAGVSSATARVLRLSHGAELGLAPDTGSGVTVAANLFEASDGPLREWRAVAKVGFIWQTAPASVRGYVGVDLGGGAIVQQVDRQAAAVSPLATVGPVLGGLTRISGRIGIVADLQPSLQVSRQDYETTVSFVPAAWLGATLGL